MDKEDYLAGAIYQSMSNLLLEGLRALTLANGGAIVALLAFLGSLTSTCHAVPDLKASLGSFSFGLLLCIVAYFGAYKAELLLLLQTPAERYKTNQTRKHPRFAWARLVGVLCIAALAAFLLGALLMHNAYSAFHCKPAG